MCNTDSGACVKGVSVHTLHDIDIDIDNLTTYFVLVHARVFEVFSVLSSSVCPASREPRNQCKGVRVEQRAPRVALRVKQRCTHHKLGYVHYISTEGLSVGR